MSTNPYATLFILVPKHNYYIQISKHKHKKKNKEWANQF